MNEPTCGEARRWMAMAREHGDDAPVGVAFHLDRCAACATLARRYRDGVRALALATASGPTVLPPAAAVVAAARRPERRWAAGAVGAAVLAAAAAVALSVRSPQQVEPEQATRLAALAQLSPQRTEASEAAVTWEASRVTAPADRERVLEDPATATLRLGPGTEASMPRWSETEAEVALSSGSVDATVYPRVGVQRFVVRTRELVATAIGTRFSVERDPDAGTRVRVDEGIVFVEVRAGGEATLGGGDELLVGIAQPADPPERAATAPSDGARSDGAGGHPPAAAEPEPSLDARIGQARRLLARGDEAAATALLTAMVPRSEADQATIAALQGDAHVIAGRLSDARDAYARAAEHGSGQVALSALVELATVQTRLGEAAAAERTWRRVLELEPSSAVAARALVALGDDAAVLQRFPGTSQASGALMRLGRAALDAGRWDAAVALFESHLDSHDPARAELAWVGLMRARLGQGQLDALRSLIEGYEQRFPTGSRRDEVARLRAAAGL